jgi:hypothetical protein
MIILFSDRISSCDLNAVGKIAFDSSISQSFSEFPISFLEPSKFNGISRQFMIIASLQKTFI